MTCGRNKQKLRAAAASSRFSREERYAGTREVVEQNGCKVPTDVSFTYQNVKKKHDRYVDG